MNGDFDNDLQERLISQRNMIELALLAIENDRMELVPTALEESYYMSQELIDDYCVEDKND